MFRIGLMVLKMTGSSSGLTSCFLFWKIRPVAWDIYDLIYFSFQFFAHISGFLVFKMTGSSSGLTSFFGFAKSQRYEQKTEMKNILKKSGKFMHLSQRSAIMNTYYLSKVLFKCPSIDTRTMDTPTTASIKSWLYFSKTSL